MAVAIEVFSLLFGSNFDTLMHEEDFFFDFFFLKVWEKISFRESIIMSKWAILMKINHEQ